MKLFSFWDYVILAMVLISSAAVGLYYRFSGGKQKTANEYLLGDRKMSTLPVACSLMASFMSAVTLLGLSMETYQFGTMFVAINIAYIITTPVMTYLILPVFYCLKTASVYEYLEKRFGFTTRLCASMIFSIQMVFYIGVALFAPSLALEAVTGLNENLSILLLGLVCTFYSTLGGLKAVLLTDIFQSLLMFAAVYSVIICAVVKAGGLEDIWMTAVKGGRIEFDNFSLNPTTRHTWWTMIIGGGVTYISIYGVNQSQVQKLISVRNLKASQAALWWVLPILCALSLSTSFSGLCIYYYYKNCDPVLEGRISSRDQLMPLFVVDTMSHIPGVSGLFVSGIFSASLSTISGAISSLAAVSLEDYMKPLYLYLTKRTLDDRKTAMYTKLVAGGVGFICIGLAFLARSLGGVLQASLTIFGVIGGPLLGIFSLGIFTTSANQKGVLTGLLIGLVISCWIGFGSPKPPASILSMNDDGCPIHKSNTSNIYSIFVSNSNLYPANNERQHYFYLYQLSYMWLSVIGFLITFAFGFTCSWIYAKFNIDNNDCIYSDATRTNIKCDLFAPPIAKRLQLIKAPTHQHVKNPHNKIELKERFRSISTIN